MFNFQRFLRDDTGATAVEYCVMLALIIMAAIAAVTTFGQATNSSFTHTQSKLQSVGFGQ